MTPMTPPVHLRRTPPQRVRSALRSSRRALRTLVVPALLLAACTTRPEAQQAAGDSSSAGAASDSPARPAAAAPDSLLRPKPPLVPTPDVIRGLYVNRWAAVGQKMWQLIDVAKKTEINALVIDVKDDRGFVLYRSKVPLARQIGADTNTPMSAKRMRAVLDSMRVHGIYPIARIVVVKDPLLAQKKLEWAVRRRDDPGKPWLDKNGNPWLDPHHDGVWRYAADLAKEAVDLGFSEVQLDYVRFPDEKRLHREATFPLAKGRSRAQVIRDQLGMTRELLEPTGVPMTIDVFGLTTSDSTDMGIGQKWEAFIDRADAVLPMTYPSHYARGNYGLANPNASPYATIDRALEDAKRRTHPFADSAAKIIPWYQDFTLGAPRYGATQVRAQMQAGYDNGFPSWILWNPRSVYTISALKPDGEERKPVEPWRPSRDSVPPPPAPADSARRDSIPPAPAADSVAARTPPDSAPAPPRR